MVFLTFYCISIVLVLCLLFCVVKRVTTCYVSLAVHLNQIIGTKAMAPHSSTLTWKIPWTEESCGLPSMGSHRVGHDWRDLAAAAAASTLVSLTSYWADMLTEEKKHALRYRLSTFHVTWKRHGLGHVETFSVLSPFRSVFVLLSFKLEHKIYMCFSEVMLVLLRKRFEDCHKGCSSMQLILLKTFTQMCLNYLYHK